MHVRCPSCQTVFRLPSHALDTARGLVRCGCCDALFDGRLELVPAYTSELAEEAADDPGEGDSQPASWKRSPLPLPPGRVRAPSNAIRGVPPLPRSSAPARVS